MPLAGGVVSVEVCVAAITYVGVAMLVVTNGDVGLSFFYISNANLKSSSHIDPVLGLTSEGSELLCFVTHRIRFRNECSGILFHGFYSRQKLSK